MGHKHTPLYIRADGINELVTLINQVNFKCILAERCALYTQDFFCFKSSLQSSLTECREVNTSFVLFQNLRSSICSCVLWRSISFECCTVSCREPCALTKTHNHITWYNFLLYYSAGAWKRGAPTFSRELRNISVRGWGAARWQSLELILKVVSKHCIATAGGRGSHE